jgi:glutamate racemase
LEETLTVPVIGVILPGAHAAIAATRNGHVGVIGTRATINSGAYARALRAGKSDVRITSAACPLLVPLIEEGWLENEVTDRVIQEYLEPLLREKIDTLVLGCTHYPLLRAAFARIAGPEITLVDSAQNCARAVRDLLAGQSLQTSSKRAGSLRVELTDPADNFLRVAEDALQLQLGEVALAKL